MVFVFNRPNERAIDELEYPAMIRGIQDAYAEKSLMVTPAPEWQLGEYHLYSSMEEFDDIFETPEQEDFEPEAWEKLIREAEDFTVTDTSFLFVVLGSGVNWLTSIIKNGVNVRGGAKTNLVEVTFDSVNPQFTAEIANSLVDAYIEQGLV
ncbi:MAG: hypothetical protein ACI9SX_001306 [Pseudoalteromonas tetraodonis]|jgi:hypothetical protein